MDIQVISKGGSTGTLTYGKLSFPCALGKSGIIREKREGDHATPIGRYPLRRLLFRADKSPAPDCNLLTQEIKPSDGWCDDPDNTLYNRPVELPFDGRHEKIWRDDDLYDFVVVLGHNDSPPVPGMGSCIFMHIAQSDYSPTEGCIALKKQDMILLLSELSPESHIVIHPKAVNTGSFGP
ncbi:MAG: L,D-transpeptidase family protein [Proteobacteria bacterium]|nr:L,D-transpeptidase family protein [Pseudomonadota bacterium]